MPLLWYRDPADGVLKPYIPPQGLTEADAEARYGAHGGIQNLNGTVTSSVNGMYLFSTLNSPFIGWGTKVIQSGGGIMVLETGWYRLTAHGGFGSNGTGVIRMLAIRLYPDSLPPGMQQLGTAGVPSASTSGYGFLMSVSGMWLLQANDVVALYARQDSGANLAINAMLEVERVVGAP
jgi:hypothetical protein